MRVPAPIARAIARGAADLLLLPGTLPPPALGKAMSVGHEVRVTPTHRTKQQPPIPNALVERAGYPNETAFRAGWVDTHDRDWATRQERYLEAHAAVDEAFLHWLKQQRYADRWASLPVWVITVTPTDTPRLLAARSDELYVSDPARALSDEPEALTQDQHRQHVKYRSERTNAKHREALARDRALLDREERIRRVMDAARRKGIAGVIRPEVDALRKMIRAGRNEQAIVLELGRLEERVKPEAA